MQVASGLTPTFDNCPSENAASWTADKESFRIVRYRYALFINGRFQNLFLSRDLSSTWTQPHPSHSLLYPFFTPSLSPSFDSMFISIKAEKKTERK